MRLPFYTTKFGMRLESMRAQRLQRWNGSNELQEIYSWQPKERNETFNWIREFMWGSAFLLYYLNWLVACQSNVVEIVLLPSRRVIFAHSQNAHMEPRIERGA